MDMDMDMDMEPSWKVLLPDYIPFKYIEKTQVVIVQNEPQMNDSVGPIFERKKELNTGCFGEKIIDPYFYEHRTYDIFCLNSTSNRTPPKNYIEFSEIIEDEPSFITSYCTLVLRKIFHSIELYNMCTSLSERNKGYSYRIFETLDLLENVFLSEIPNNNYTSFWLCIDPNVKNARELLQYYSHHGFENPAVTKYASDNETKITNDYYISLSKYTQRHDVKKNRIYKLYHNYIIPKYYNAILEHTDIITNTDENKNIYLHMESFIHIFMNYLHSEGNPTNPVSQTEHSGSFIVGRFENKNVLFLDYQSIIHGTVENVDLNIYSNINFHTHPSRVMQHYNLKTAWPSIEDWGVAMNGRNIADVNMIFSIEGLYIYKLTPQFKVIYNKADKTTKSHIKSMYDEHIKKYEKNTFPSNNINEYLQRINSHQITLITGDTVIPLFVRLIPIETFRTDVQISSFTIDEILSSPILF